MRSAARVAIEYATIMLRKQTPVNALARFPRVAYPRLTAGGWHGTAVSQKGSAWFQCTTVFSQEGTSAAAAAAAGKVFQSTNSYRVATTAT